MQEPGQQLAPWCQKRSVGMEGSFLQVFGSAIYMQWRLTFMVRYCSRVAVVVIDSLTTEAILRLDVLSQYTVDLLHRKLITGAGLVVTLCC